MKTNKKPTWITISDDGERNGSVKKETFSDKVTHKGFWAAGFVALVAFAFVLSIPQQLSGFMKAELFDGEFKVIPDSESQGGNVFFSEGQNTENASESEQQEGNELQGLDQPEEAIPSQNEGGIQVESEATPIQIDPIEESETIDLDPPAEEVPLTEEELLESDELLTEEEPSDLQQLLESLNAQLEELKKDSQQKDAEIQALMDQLQNPAGLHEAAESQSNLPDQSGSLPPTDGPVGEYRYNTHTVTVNPYDVLAKNRLSASQIEQQALQANMTQNTVPSYQNNLSLSGVQTQPTTGPALNFALIFSAIAILGFGIYRHARA